MKDIIKKIKKKFFPLKYITLREFYAPTFLLLFVLSIPCYICLCSNGGADSSVHISFIVLGACCIYCNSFKPLQKLFKKLGKRYDAKIIRSEYTINRGEPINYLYIKFYKNKRKYIRRTCAYNGNPNLYLKNNICSVYEYMGKFIEADFNLRDEPEDGDHILLRPYKGLKFKGDKYV